MAASIVYLNGEYLPQDQAFVSVNERGFLFGDGVYEVTPAYRGKLFRYDAHRRRLARGLSGLKIPYDAGGVREIKLELLARNGLDKEEAAYAYLQVTRGAAPRSHAFPAAETLPTVYAFARPHNRPDRERWEKGFAAITVFDQRWARADIKAITLLPNVLAQQAAVDAGVSDAIFVRDGIAMEGAHNNLFAVRDGVLMTAPRSNYILHGVTRDLVLELARKEGIRASEASIPASALAAADEIFMTGTTTEVRPVVRLNGRAVGDGRVGSVTRRLYDAFLEETALGSDP